MVVVPLGQADDLSREGSKKKSALKKNKDGSLLPKHTDIHVAQIPIHARNFQIPNYSWSKCKKQ